MSKRHFISLRTKDSINEVNIEIPGDKPIEQSMPDLLKVIKWQSTSGNTPIRYYLQNEEGKKLDLQKSLTELEIENFEVLWIFADEQKESRISEDVNSSKRIPGDDIFTSEEAEEDGLPSPVSMGLPIDQPCLVSDSGFIFILAQKTMLVGRKSKENNPDIDLSELDTDFICSRRHAEIGFATGDYYIRAFATRNNTFLNGYEIKPGEPYKLNNEDTIQFGFRGVQVIFRIP